MKNRKLLTGKKYHIFWHDTIGIEQWCDWENITERGKECASNQETIGFYVGKSSDYEIFCSTINRARNMLPYAQVSLIPTGVIKKIKLLK